jgi:CRP-like cAMP-binding protein
LNLLDKLSAEDRGRLLALGRSLVLDAGEELVRQGSVGDCLFVVQDGEVEVVRCLPGDAENVLLVAGPGMLLGELAVLDGGARAASLRARSRSALRVIRLGAFEALALHGGEAGHRILSAVAAMVHERLNATRCVAVQCADSLIAACAGRARIDWRVPAHEVSAVMRVLSPFAGLRDTEMGAMLPALRTATITRGAELVLPEAQEPGVIMVLRGALSPWLDAGRGPEVSMPVVGPGGFVDYAAALGFALTPRRWRARSPTRLLRLDPALFAAGAESSAELLYALSRDLATVLRRATGLAMHFGTAWARPGARSAPAQRPAPQCLAGAPRHE